MEGLLKYGAGMPFNRIEQLQAATRIPLSAALTEDTAAGRTGVFTSGIVATSEGREIALFFTGVCHVGENLAAVLEHRAVDLPALIQMCDGFSNNMAGDFEALLAKWVPHARRKYVEVADHLPEEVRSRPRSPASTATHQQESGPRMAQLEQWMQRLFIEHLVEPNSGLGEAIRYMQKRWNDLTLFLRIAGASLDNNVTERAPKKAILHERTRCSTRHSTARASVTSS